MLWEYSVAACLLGSALASQSHRQHHQKRDTIIAQNANTTKFVVDGKAIPDVDFDIGESYAGLLPISPASSNGTSSSLYFWFFPSSNPLATDEILIWLNGGPGCSSLGGLLQENGPFLWQYGTFRPAANPYSWHNLTNVVYIDQPAGTGFSPVGNGTPAVVNELDVAEQFLGFWKNFIDTFSLHNRKVYLTGESFAGAYVSYIADAMHNRSDTVYYNAEGALMYDPYLTDAVVQYDIPTLPFVEYWAPILNLNETFVEDMRTRDEECGYKAFREEAFTFPPKGPLSTPPNIDYARYGCNPWNDVLFWAPRVNPCFNVYNVATMCPVPWDVLGFPGTWSYLPPGQTTYFNRTDVQQAINAPLGSWTNCADNILSDDDSPAPASSSSAGGILPRVIERNNRTILAHSLQGFKFLMNGTLIAIQNMTFHGSQGFSQGPSQWEDFFVPYHARDAPEQMAGSGVMGKHFTERGLTFSTVSLAGHMVPQYAPGAAYRHVEFLLGRIESLSDETDFSTQEGSYGNGFGFVTTNSTELLYLYDRGYVQDGFGDYDVAS